jgi:hypothetical protein
MGDNVQSSELRRAILMNGPDFLSSECSTCQQLASASTRIITRYVTVRSASRCSVHELRSIFSSRKDPSLLVCGTGVKHYPDASDERLGLTMLKVKSSAPIDRSRGQSSYDKVCSQAASRRLRNVHDVYQGTLPAIMSKPSEEFTRPRSPRRSHTAGVYSCHQHNHQHSTGRHGGSTL